MLGTELNLCQPNTENAWNVLIKVDLTILNSDQFIIGMLIKG